MFLVGLTIDLKIMLYKKNTCKAFSAALSIVHRIYLYNLLLEKHDGQTYYPHWYQQSVSQGVGISLWTLISRI
jgi:hypothetical protein